LHEHGSIEYILAFLGENNWKRTKIRDLVCLSDKADPELLNGGFKTSSFWPYIHGLICISLTQS
jgi:hypothetical protein